MQCPNGHESPEGQAFCGKCGQALVPPSTWLPVPPVPGESHPPPKQQKRRISPATVWLIIGVSVLMGIVGALTREQSSSSEQGSGQGVTSDVSESVDSTDTFTMPDVVGVGLQDAQDGLQSLGSYLLDQEDASGMGRMQILDSNWVVCEQSPAAGVEVSVDDLITLWSVQIGESCR